MVTDLMQAELPTDEQMIEAAREKYQREGEIEIDDQVGTAMVSRGDDPGAYVQAWVWVYYDEVDV